MHDGGIFFPLIHATLFSEEKCGCVHATNTKCHRVGDGLRELHKFRIIFTLTMRERERQFTFKANSPKKLYTTFLLICTFRDVNEQLNTRFEIPGFKYQDY